MEIGLRSTKIYDIVNHVIIIISKCSSKSEHIKSYKARQILQIEIEVGVSYDLNPDEVEAALLEVKENSNIER